MEDKMREAARSIKSRLDEECTERTVIRKSNKGDLFGDNEFPFKLFFSTPSKSEINSINSILESEERVSGIGVPRVANSMYGYIIDFIITI